jgi:hypothetical protein
MKKTLFIAISLLFCWCMHGQNVVTLQLPEPCVGTSVPQYPTSDQPQFTVSPNPSNGDFTLYIACPASIGKVHLTVTSLEGVLLYRQDYYTKESMLQSALQLHHLASGIYMVTLICDQGTSTQKIIIQK